MCAASASFTGEMSPAEQWVAEAQAQGDSALHPISDEQQRNLAESANIDDNIALDVYEFKNSSNNDKNADGKVTKSVKDKVKEYIGSLSIPADQKNALYYSLYKEW